MPCPPPHRPVPPAPTRADNQGPPRPGLFTCSAPRTVTTQDGKLPPPGAAAETQPRSPTGSPPPTPSRGAADPKESGVPGGVCAGRGARGGGLPARQVPARVSGVPPAPTASPPELTASRPGAPAPRPRRSRRSREDPRETFPSGATRPSRAGRPGLGWRRPPGGARGARGGARGAVPSPTGTGPEFPNRRELSPRPRGSRALAPGLPARRAAPHSGLKGNFPGRGCT